MSWIPDRYRELRTLLRPDRIEDEVDEELSLHLEMRAADLAALGMTEAEAREDAVRRFGNVSNWRTQTCEIDESIKREQRRMEVFDAVRRETRHAVRSLARAPLFTIVAVLTLGLGIGATTAIFTLLDSIVLRPLPYPSSNRLVQVASAVPKMGDGQEWGNSVAGYFSYLDENLSFEKLGAYSESSFNLTDDRGAERVDGASTTASLLTVLGARAVEGRLYTEQDEALDANAVVLISHELWQGRFNGDPDIIGTEMRANSEPVTIIGVLEPGFTLPGRETLMWRPLRMSRTAQPQNYHWVL